VQTHKQNVRERSVLIPAKITAYKTNRTQDVVSRPMCTCFRDMIWNYSVQCYASKRRKQRLSVPFHHNSVFSRFSSSIHNENFALNTIIITSSLRGLNNHRGCQVHIAIQVANWLCLLLVHSVCADHCCVIPLSTFYAVFLASLFHA